MKVIAMLSWFEERPSWLSATVASLRGLCDHIVAVDGAYALFPDARPRSGPEQAEAVIETAHASNIGLTLHRPKHVWRGNEVQKRNHLVQLAMLEAEPNVDWLFRIDGDETVTDIPFGIHTRLEAETLDVGGVTLWTRSHLQGSKAPADIQNRFDTESAERGLRFLIRALPGLRVENYHAGYVAAYGPPLEELPAADYSDLRIEHRHQYRRDDRNKRGQRYYEVRDELGIELARV